jgi:hypothetical protein
MAGAIEMYRRPSPANRANDVAQPPPAVIRRNQYPARNVMIP